MERRVVYPHSGIPPRNENEWAAGTHYTWPYKASWDTTRHGWVRTSKCLLPEKLTKILPTLGIDWRLAISRHVYSRENSSFQLVFYLSKWAYSQAPCSSYAVTIKTNSPFPVKTAAWQPLERKNGFEVSQTPHSQRTVTSIHMVVPCGSALTGFILTWFYTALAW